MSDSVVLQAGGKSVELPILKPTLGNDCVDVSKLTRETGLFTYDSGFTATASCKSAITYIDGDKGVLLYRGYPIEQLAEQSTFLEVSYLVLYGELPTAGQLAEFTGKISNYTIIDERLRELYRSFPRRSHPMPVLAAGLNA